MKTIRTVVLAVSAGLALAATAPAFAGGWDHARGYGNRHEEGRGYYGQPRVVYAPAPVYYRQPQVIYAPAPVYYGPPQVVYAQPPVAYSQPAPVYASSPNAGNIGGAI